ncbi:MAG TPA: Imm49 family immunity protein, partial [Polyangia bacterium]|nr:Imm49 family immunity protein [Polyangia bacterium]
MKLSEYGESLAYDVAFWMQGLDGSPPAQLGSLSLELSDKLRSLAIVTLLVKASTDFFLHNLIRSARAREIYLQRVQAEGLPDDHHRVLGRYEPLLDGIAAADWTRVEHIRALSPPDYRPGHEYEDDHWYARILHELAAPAPDEAGLPAMLESFEKALQGLTPARLEVCRALAARDQQAFDAAFEGLLDQQAAQIEEDKKRGKLEDPVVIAQRQVSIEGLAILRLAERRGLTTATEYRYCP